LALAGSPGLGNDFRKGPFAESGIYTSPYPESWDTSIFQICQSEIDHFYNWWACDNGIIQWGCGSVPEPSDELLTKIYNWPAHGNYLNGEAFYLLPFNDYNSDGVYDPNDGDTPRIERGCCMTYILLNDDKPHSYSGGAKLGIEVHIILYQYNVWGGFLDNTTFMDVFTVNKSDTTYYDYNSSLFLDADLGYYGDDFVGCDSTLNLSYTYNGDNNDEDNGGQMGYGINPPAIGIVNLTNTMSSSNWYNANFSISNFYNLMNGYESDGSPILDDSGQPTNFRFHDDPNNPVGWSEYALGYPPGDRRLLISQKTNTFGPGDIVRNSYAILFAEGTSNLNSVSNLLTMATDAKDFYMNESQIACENNYWGVEELEEDVINIFPNPSSGLFHVEMDDVYASITLSVFDITGRKVMTKKIVNSNQFEIDLNGNSGVFILTIESPSGTITKRLIVD
jgi:hypothetical protein